MRRRPRHGRPGPQNPPLLLLPYALLLGRRPPFLPRPHVMLPQRLVASAGPVQRRGSAPRPGRIRDGLPGAVTVLREEQKRRRLPPWSRWPDLRPQSCCSVPFPSAQTSHCPSAHGAAPTLLPGAWTQGAPGRRSSARDTSSSLILSGRVTRDRCFLTFPPASLQALGLKNRNETAMVITRKAPIRNSCGSIANRSAFQRSNAGWES